MIELYQIRGHFIKTNYGARNTRMFSSSVFSRFFPALSHDADTNPQITSVRERNAKLSDQPRRQHSEIKHKAIATHYPSLFLYRLENRGNALALDHAVLLIVAPDAIKVVAEIRAAHVS